VCGCIACPARQVRIDRHPFGVLPAEFSALAVSWELSGPSRFRRRKPLIAELTSFATTNAPMYSPALSAETKVGAVMALPITMPSSIS